MKYFMFRQFVIISAFQILQNQNEIIFITRPIDKKKVLFYNDRTANLTIDEEFQKLWRSVAVDAMDDGKIEEYLDKQGNNLQKCRLVDYQGYLQIIKKSWPFVLSNGIYIA